MASRKLVLNSRTMSSTRMSVNSHSRTSKPTEGEMSERIGRIVSTRHGLGRGQPEPGFKKKNGSPGVLSLGNMPESKPSSHNAERNATHGIIRATPILRFKVSFETATVICFQQRAWMRLRTEAIPPPALAEGRRTFRAIFCAHLDKHAFLKRCIPP